MQIPDRKNRFSGFCSGCRRSQLEWEERLGAETMLELIDLGALKPLSGKTIDGFEGRFDFGGGTEDYRLFTDDNWAIAHPVHGGDAVDASYAKVFEAVPFKIVEAIARAGKFSVISTSGPNGDIIVVLERKIDNVIVRVLVVLDDSWLTDFAAEEWFKQIAQPAQIFIMLRDGGCRIPWELERAAVARALPMPSTKTGWAIDTRVYCDSRANIPTRELAKICIDKKVVFSSLGKELFVFGEPLDLEVGGRPYQYLVTLLQIGTSPMAEDEFAKRAFGIHEVRDAEVRGARNGVKEAIEKALKQDPIRSNEATTLITPRPKKKKTITSGLKPEDILILPLP